MIIRRLPASTAFSELLAAVLLAFLGLSGCGSGGQDESGTGIAQEPAATAEFRGSNAAAPAEPLELSANAVSSGEIDLAWSPGPEDPKIDGYRVLRDGTQIALLDDVTAYEDTGLSASTEYAYIVEAINAAGKTIVRSPQTAAITLPVDPTPPQVSSVSTEDATPVAVNSAINVDFSAPMAKSTMNANTFKVATRTGEPIAGTVSVTGTTATFTPSAELAADTELTVTVTTDATDTAGNALASGFTTTFATAAVADVTPPKVSFMFPASDATGVAMNSSVAVTFSEAMTNSTLTTASFKLRKASGGTALAATVKVSGNTALLTPSANLAKNTLYTAILTKAVLDAAGNPLEARFTWNFMTGATADATAPRVIGTYPTGGSMDATLNSTVVATFSEPMMNSTLSIASFLLKESPSGTPVRGTALYYPGSNAVRFQPSRGLVAGMKYTATVTTAAKDLAGIPLAANYRWTFTAAGSSDVAPPTVLSTSPKNLATGIPLTSPVSATFSEAMKDSTLTSASFVLKKSSNGTAINGTVSMVGNTATFTPSTALAGDTQYTATIGTGAKDAAGNPLATSFSWRFTTAAAATTATLTWDAVGSSDLQGYRVYYGTAPRTYLQSPGQGLNIGNVTTYTVSGLKSATRYYFAVTAYNSAGKESGYSNEGFKDIP